jgi:hypothetical protein
MKSDVLPAKVERCRIVTVNTRDFTVDVRQEFQPYAAKFDIPFASPYCHQSQGEGINFMPEVGATCWVCSPSEDGRESFVLSFTMVDEDSSYRGGRVLLNPGDLHFSTRDGNFVTIRRGGVVQIGATPICQRVFIPIRNVIQDFAENYELHTPAGDLTWLVARTDEQADGHQKCALTLAAKEFSDDPNDKPVALLKIGSHGDGNETILTLQTLDKGGGSVQTTLEVTKSGELKWSVKKYTFAVEQDASVAVKGKLSMDITGDASLSSGGTALVKGGSEATIQVGSSSVKTDAAGTHIKGSVVEIGDALAPVLRNTPDFLVWMTMVTAALNLSGPVAGLSGALVPPTQHFNPKVMT